MWRIFLQIRPFRIFYGGEVKSGKTDTPANKCVDQIWEQFSNVFSQIEVTFCNSTILCRSMSSYIHQMVPPINRNTLFFPLFVFNMTPSSKVVFPIKLHVQTSNQRGMSGFLWSVTYIIEYENKDFCYCFCFHPARKFNRCSLFKLDTY